MIKFHSITIEGVGSIQGPITILFKKRGLVIIRGENGVGKTTILLALVWCLYNTLIKKGSSILTWEHKRPKDYKGAKVEVIFYKDSIKYSVIRCMEYKGKVEGVAGKNRVFLYKDDKLQNDKGVKDVKVSIIELLGMSPELFCSSILFGQKMKRLIEEDGPKKKQVLEEAFDITFINKAQDLAKKERERLNITYTEQYRKLAGLNATIEAKKSEINSIRVLSEEFENRKRLKLKGIREKIRALREEVQAIKEGPHLTDILVKASTDKVRKEMADCKEEKLKYKDAAVRYSTAYNRGKVLKKEIEELEAELEPTRNTLEQREALKCSKCGQYMDDRTAYEIFHELEVDLNTKNLALSSNNKVILRHQKEIASLSKLEDKYILLENKLNKILDAQSRAKLANSKIEGKEGLIQSLKQDLVDAKAEQPNFNLFELGEALGKLIVQQGPLSEACSKLARRLKLLDWIIATPLSNSGLKVFVFNQMIQKVNAKLKNYSSYIGFTPRFEVDLVGARKDINMVVYDGKYPIPFQDLSGGQTQMVNVATAFAIHDIVSDGNINILFLDEVFESLSAANVEIVSSIISQKSSDKVIYLITHLQDFITQTVQTLDITRNSNQTLIG